MLLSLQSGIIQRETCDERRSSYATADGGFDADAFAADVQVGRRTVAIGYCVLPGLPLTLQTLLFIKLDGWSAVLAQLETTQGKMIWDLM